MKESTQPIYNHLHIFMSFLASKTGKIMGLLVFISVTLLALSGLEVGGQSNFIFRVLMIVGACTGFIHLFAYAHETAVAQDSTAARIAQLALELEGLAIQVSEMADNSSESTFSPENQFETDNLLNKVENMRIEMAALHNRHLDLQEKIPEIMAMVVKAQSNLRKTSP